MDRTANHRERTLRGTGLLMLLFAADVGASTYRVGSDPACSHASLDAALAAAATNDEDANTIRLTAGTLAALPEPLLIDGRSVQVIGGFADCSAATPTARTAIFGAAGVLRVHGETAVPFEVTLRGVDLAAQDRRAIDHDGTATLRLEDTTVSGGHAGPQDIDQFGGGIRVQGAGATLVLGAAVRVFGNHAVAGGGGVYCRGAQVQLEAGSSIDGNTSDGDGGGVFLDGCAFTDASGGAARAGGGNFGITGNSAGGNGGGIYAGNSATLEILGTDDATLIAGNTAANGAGLYLAGAGSGALLVNGNVAGNSARRFGGGLYVRDGATLQMGRYSVDCPGEIFCSRLDDNHAANGSALAADGGAQAAIKQTAIRHNAVSGAGGAAIDSRGADTVTVLEGAVLWDHAPAPASYTDGGAWLRAAFVSSFANGGAFALGNGGSASVYSSVIQDDVFLLPGSGSASRFADCVTAKEIASIPPDLDGIEQLDDPAALFKAPASGDFRPRPRARAIDRCDTWFYPPTTLDLFGFPRGFDVPSVHWSPSFGDIDRGAIEAPWLFADDFEE